MATVFALVDCNNFYASCEKLFRPDLQNSPVLVLSNNDGCVIARSAEAKKLGIKMGIPFHQVQDDIARHQITVFSSNYALYADMSARVMQTLTEMAVQTEIYSIDEAFCDLTGLNTQQSFEQYGLMMRERIRQWLGLSVCVGISSTKTLAKLANNAAKKYPKTGGVVDLLDKTRQQRLLHITPVSDVWGVGKRLGKRLNEMQIHTALDLANANRSLIRNTFSVVLERTQQELNGEPCIELEDIPPAKKQIVCSRSFGQRITDIKDMHAALANHVACACTKLRQEKQCAKNLTIFFHTGKFNNPFYGPHVSGSLMEASNDTRDFLPLIDQLLQAAWREDYRYAKAGVMLADFYPETTAQASLFSPAPQNNRLMNVLDQMNRASEKPLFFARQGTQRQWEMKREYLSPAYTTQWQGLRNVH